MDTTPIKYTFGELDTNDLATLHYVLTSADIATISFASYNDMIVMGGDFMDMRDDIDLSYPDVDFFELIDANRAKITELHTLLTTRHVRYPHNPGYLIDCPACERVCWCQPGNAECVYTGHSAQTS